MLVLGFAPFDLWPLAALAPAVLCWVAVHPALDRGTVLIGTLLFGASFITSLHVTQSTSLDYSGFLSLIFLIRELRVDGLSPSRSAAPPGP